jgi:hypothetical protein
MAADDSALVPVAPDDTVDTVLRKIHGTGAASVQLLVPDDTPALQAPRGFERLRRALDQDGIDLLVISSDDQTLAAARRNAIATVGVAGARVQPAGAAPGASPASKLAAQQPTAPIDARDAAFLDALDRVPAEDRYDDLASEDDELYAAIDELADTPASRPAGRPTGRYSTRADDVDDDFAADYDDWDDPSTADTVAAQTPPSGTRDNDTIDEHRHQTGGLSAEDRARIQARHAAAQRARADARAETARSQAARRPSTGGRAYRDEEVYVAPRRNLAVVLLPIAIVALLALGAVYWLIQSRVVVAVSPPAATVREFPFTNQVIPLVENGSTNTSAAIQASSVTAEAEATVTGQVTQETIAPSGTARGEVTIVNTIENAVPLPSGSEFIGTNDRGEEVRFTLDADTTIPPAVTTSSLTGRSTSYGQTTVTITARSPGSASNVGENAIKQILIPGQQPIISDQSNFLLRNGPIGGGSEAPQRVVTDVEVQGVLQEALTQLYNNGFQQLSGQIDESKAGIDPTTITPSTTDLGSPDNYEVVSIQPGIGEQVDAANPNFSVTVRARFNALATPRDSSVINQLQTVAPQYFSQLADRPCRQGEQQGTSVNAVRWNGQRLTIDGAISCTPQSALSAETIAKVKDALLNQSRDAAEAALRTLAEQGLIGGYQLPAGRTSFPRFDWLIDVEVGAAPPALPQPTGAPQPTSVAHTAGGVSR